jgi:peroxiredoxin
MQPGDQFPDVTLPDADGTPHRLSSFWADGPALIVIGHTGCDTTRFTLPHAEKLNTRRDPAARVVAVLQDEPEAARAIAAKQQLTMPILLDADPYALVTGLGMDAVPMSFLVEPGGRVASIATAFRRADMEAFAGALGVPPPLYAAGEKAPALRPG